MKKTILFLLFLFSISKISAQFTVTNSSKNWQEIGQYWKYTYLYKTSDKAKFKYIDFKTKKPDLGAFKSKYQNSVDELNKKIEDNTNDVKDGFYEFVFSIDENTLNNLYDIIRSHFETKIKEELTLSFPEGDIYLKFGTFFGTYNLSFGFDKELNKNGGNINYSRIYTQPLTFSNVNKLFGKK